MGMKERGKGKEPQKAKRNREVKRKKGTWEGVKIGVCVPRCENALLATIETCLPKIFLALLWPPHSKKAGAATGCEENVKLLSCYRKNAKIFEMFPKKTDTDN